jgi:hypothetical protein
MNSEKGVYMRVLVSLTVALLVGLLLPAVPAVAASEPPDDGVVIWNEDYVLAEDEILDGDLVVFNGDVTLESGSRVKGNVVIWSGNAEASGLVGGNLVISNGKVRLEEDAHVEGDVVCSWNCDIQREEGARVDGDIIEGPTLQGFPFADWGERGLRIRVPSRDAKPFWLSGPEQLLKWVFRVVRALVTILVIAAIGGVVALIWPNATAQVGRTAFESPGASLGVGFLTIVAAIALVLALAITICLSPAAALVALFVGAAGLFGWVAIGARVGQRMLGAFGAAEVPPTLVGGLGTLVITLITVGLSVGFCLAPLGWLLLFAIGCFGLGSVVLTRFGTTAYVSGQRAGQPAPVSRPDLPERTGEPVGDDPRLASEGIQGEEPESD